MANESAPQQGASDQSTASTPSPAADPAVLAKEAAASARAALEAEHAKLQHAYGGIALTLKALKEEEELVLQQLKAIVAKIKAAM